MHTAQVGEQSSQRSSSAAACVGSAVASSQSACTRRAAAGKTPVLDSIRSITRSRVARTITTYRYRPDCSQSRPFFSFGNQPIQQGPHIPVIPVPRAHESSAQLSVHREKTCRKRVDTKGIEELLVCVEPQM